ncbi:HD-GYP domain-containing protein [Christensenellaceae bacterium OttesenSCG-928-K19]|nr:HD-GYP domain-containing protein [Christensenellaceae bacterium OttesenSCG-928-K19]
MIKIPLNEAKPGMVLAKDISSNDPTLRYLMPINSTLTEAIIKRLREYDVEEITIVGDDENGEHEIIIEDFDPTPQPTIDDQLKSEALDSLETFFQMAETGESQHTVTIIKHMDTIVEQLVDSVVDDKASFVNINDLRSYDEYTYHHSLSVAVLSTAIGQSLNLSKSDLKNLARSAMMHDIGKTSVPIDLINKPKRLTDEEFEIIKTHSANGYKYLEENQIGDKIIRQGVLSHHEKIDGSGYPLRLSGNRIPIFGRIISIADVYDALTSHRPYRTPMPTADAIEYIMGNVGAQFDLDIVKAFLEKIELYPIGTFVKLSNQDLAVVLNNINPLRPVVKNVKTREVMDLYNDYQHLSLTIIGTYNQLPAKT